MDPLLPVTAPSFPRSSRPPSSPRSSHPPSSSPFSSAFFPPSSPRSSHTLNTDTDEQIAAKERPTEESPVEGGQAFSIDKKSMSRKRTESHAETSQHSQSKEIPFKESTRESHPWHWRIPTKFKIPSIGVDSPWPLDESLGKDVEHSSPTRKESSPTDRIFDAGQSSGKGETSGKQSSQIGKSSDDSEQSPGNEKSTTKESSPTHEIFDAGPSSGKGEASQIGKSSDDGEQSPGNEKSTTKESSPTHEIFDVGPSSGKGEASQIGKSSDDGEQSLGNEKSTTKESSPTHEIFDAAVIGKGRSQPNSQKGKSSDDGEQSSGNEKSTTKESSSKGQTSGEGTHHDIDDVLKRMQFNELFSDLVCKFFLAMGGYIAFAIQQHDWITAPENETVGFVVHSWFVREYSILSLSHMSSKFPWNIISNMVICNIISNMVFCCVITAFAGKIFSGNIFAGLVAAEWAGLFIFFMYRQWQV
ncbi:hypothetical protein KIW84_046075 [Lathyrus oleraceus]|uniref:Uncharacterized protein n=1 Tax=Pisum sativum TaxID=3888 RepID=A0A9D5ASN7_PEA|nr:hypothetical protein KIW84_046075 [Pisum sativum]